jgi:hypothetical protein
MKLATRWLFFYGSAASADAVTGTVAVTGAAASCAITAVETLPATSGASTPFVRGARPIDRRKLEQPTVLIRTVDAQAAPASCQALATVTIPTLTAAVQLRAAAADVDSHATILFLDDDETLLLIAAA